MKSKLKSFLSYLLTFVLIVPFSLMSFQAPVALAATTGQNSASSATGWSNPNNSKVSDNVYTTGPSLGHIVTGFGFNIPTNATIDGVEVRVERKYTRPTSASASSVIYDQIADLVINGLPMWQQSTTYPNYNRAVQWTSRSRNAEEVKVFGGVNDKWGKADLSPADINNPNFGFDIWAMRQGNSQTTAFIDHIGMTVYYTEPVTDTTAPVFDSYSDITTEATSSAGAVISYTNPTATDNVDPTVNVNCSPASGSQFPIGTTPVGCSATDLAGNTATSGFNVIVQDTTAPTINSYQSIPNTTGDTSTITVNATDNTGITSAQIDINGAGFVSMTGTGPDYTATYDFPLNSLSPMSYVAQFSDGYGNVTTSPLQTVDPTDNKNPEINFVTGLFGTTGETTTVTVNATDNIAPTRAEISIDGGAWIPMVGGSSPFTFDVLVASNFDSPINYSVNVYDGANNVVSSGPHTITVTDNDSPSGSVLINSADTYTNTNDVTLSLNATDNIAPTSMCFRNSNTDCTNWVPYASTYEWATTTTQGTRTVHAWFMDAAGNISEASTDTITLDSVAPSIPTLLSTISNPTNLLVQVWNWAASSDATSGVAGYIYRVTGSLDLAPTFIGNVTTATTNFIDGVYNIFLRAEDNAGNQGDEASVTLTVDATAPTVPLNGLPNGISIPINNFDFTWDASSDASPVTYEFQTSNSPSEVGGELTSGLWKSGVLPSNTIHSSGAHDGIWYWQVRAIDSAGNTSPWSAIWNVTIDRTAPVITIDPYNSTSWTNQDITVNATTNEGTLNASSHTFTSNGSFNFVATDAVGNSTTRTVTVSNIDKDIPTGAITSPASDAKLRGIVNIDATADDGAGSGISKVEFYHSSPVQTLIGDATSAPYSTTWDTTGSTDGSHGIYVKVFDVAGNESGFISIPVYVDNTAPTVVSVDSDGQTYNIASDDPTIKVTFSEDIANTPQIGINIAPLDYQTVNDCSDSDAKTFCFTYAIASAEEVMHRVRVMGAEDLAGNTMSEDQSHTFIVDTVAPVIAMNGTSPITLEVHTSYSDPGATASDGFDGNLTTNISTISNVNVDQIGDYFVRYNVSDLAGNPAAEVVRTVSVVDTTAPVITLAGDNPYYVEAGSSYTDPGYFVSDNYDASVTVNVDTSGLNMSLLGTYLVYYDATDTSGNHADQKTRTVIVQDTTKPVIISLSNTPDTTGEISTIVANVSDNIGITSALININGAGFVPMPVSLIPGIYTYPIMLPSNHLDPISYTVSFDDAAGNGPTLRSGVIIPLDNDAPIITSVTGTAGTTGEKTTVTVNTTDNIAPTRAEISIDGGAWTPMTGGSSPFTYVISVPSNSVSPIDYSVNVYDAANNAATSGPKTIVVTDNDRPTGSMLINLGDPYTNSRNVELSLSPTDNIAVTQMSFRNGTSAAWSAWEPIALTKSWQLATASGTKTVQARFRDAANNVSSNKSDTIVLDRINPTAPTGLTTTPNPTNSLAQVWNWLASTDATSGIAGYIYRITGSTLVGSTFIGNVTSLTTYLSEEGIYNLFLRSQDNAGNLSEEVSSILVVDTTAPVITLQGDNPYTVEAGSSYTDPGYSATDNYDSSVTVNVDTGSLNMALPGEYTVYFDATDASGNNGIQQTRTVIVQDTTAPEKPIADPVGGDYQTSQNVVLSSSDNIELDDIYYTTDGSDPDDTKTQYSGSIAITVDTTLKAIAYDEAGNTSEVMTEEYEIAPVITGESSSNATTDSIIISWTTNEPATSRVVYGTTSHSTLGLAPNYGYSNSTIEDSNKVTAHSVTISGLIAGTTYYFRTVSHGSPESVSSSEMSFRTDVAPVLNIATANPTTLSAIVRVAALGTSANTEVETPIVSTTPDVTASSDTSTGEVKGEQIGGSTQGRSLLWLWILIAIVVLGTGSYLYLRNRKTS